MKNCNTYWLGMLALVLVFVTGCNNASEETPQLTQLPTVVSNSALSGDLLGQLSDKGTTLLGRSTEAMNIDEAVVAIYEGYETTEVVYVPDSENQSLTHVYFAFEGELQNSFMTMENHERKMIITTVDGTVSVDIDGNVVMGVDVGYAAHTAGRIECEPAKAFLECTNAVQDKLVETVGYGGALIFDIGCSLWTVCRGAFVVGCSAYAAVDCIE